jgi:hypothetical protein
MKKLLLLVFSVAFVGILHSQTVKDTLNSKIIGKQADDPADFLTRAEVFTEFQHYKNFNLELTTFRAIAKLGKRFTTRVDLPFNYNSLTTAAGYKQSGLGDISLRLLGYKIIETPKSAVTASIEVSFNTAQSPLLGTGKNLIIPVVSYTAVLNPKRILLSLVLQQANSFSGDEKRGNISFSKLQAILITIWSRKIWTVVAPEFYLDYVHGGLSMDFAGRFAYAPVPRINLWAQAGAGLFGDFPTRYIWSTQIGGRYFFMKNAISKGKKNLG